MNASLKLSLTLATLAVSGLALADHGTWRFYGGNMHNTAHAFKETEISPANVGSLVPRWIYKTAPDGSFADITSPPAVLGHMLYVADWSGNLTALDTRTKTVVWRKNFATDYSNSPLMHGLKVTFSRNTPAIIGNLLIIGGSKNVTNFATPIDGITSSGAVELAINRKTGALVWATQIDNHPTATVTQSAVAKGNTIYVGVSSVESATVATSSTQGSITVPGTNDIYQCCSFRGSIVALDKTTGAIKWKTYTLPVTNAEKDWRNRPTGPGLSYSGGSVWGSTPVIDLARNTLYIGTSQTHTIPLTVAQANGLVFPYSTSNPPHMPAGNYSASIIALDLTTGAIKWAKPFGKLAGFDGWNTGCISFLGLVLPSYGLDFSSTAYCPANEDVDATTAANNFAKINNPFDFFISSGGTSPLAPNGPFANVLPPYPSGPQSWDEDFAQGPMYVRNVKMPNGSYKDLLIAAQKSGVTRALDPANGNVIWATFEGPGGTEGGHEWGSATDGKRVYLANNNGTNSPIKIKDINGNITTTNGGYWSALDIATGKILWETAAPLGAGAINPFSGQVGPGTVTGAVSVANGVVYAGVKEDNGTVYAMDASTGKILFTFPTGNKAAGHPASFNGRVTIANGVIYFGSGASYYPFAYGNNKLFALALPAHQCYPDDETDQDDDNDGNFDGDDNH